MKILMISSCDLKRELGGAKPLIGVAEELRKLHWQCDMLAPNQIHKDGVSNKTAFHQALRKYLIENSKKYDIVDYNQDFLPYPRTDFPKNTLFVARSVLLYYHFLRIHTPAGLTLKEKVYKYTKWQWLRLTQERQHVKTITETFRGADLINLSNDDDRTEVQSRGFDANKICVIPYGLTENERNKLFDVPSAAPGHKKIVFVGTFEPRKGASDMPEIFDHIAAAIPDVSFKLIGTYKGPEQVKSYFSQKLRDRIEVIPSYSADKLSTLLSDGTVGIFPSYVEGCPFAVLEMLAASLPVYGYDSPGLSVMLRKSNLARRGDKKGLALKIIDTLQNNSTLSEGRVQARKDVAPFSWDKIAATTAAVYTDHLARLRSIT